jgi:ABC-2 type transport system ATP-binding protein
VTAPLAVQAARLGRDYGATRALDGLDLEVPAGALVGLLGPNGAGKTTAMLLLATLLAPTRGSAAVFGHDVRRDRRAARGRLGLVFQEPSVDGLLTVEENLRFAARLAGLREREAATAVRAALERAGLAARAAQPARTLSGGWRRLADIARATLHRPSLLILDEPTVGLDPEHRERVWALLEEERRARGCAVLFSTHYLAEAEPADHVVLLAHGREAARGAPGALRDALGAAVVELDGSGAAEAARLLQCDGLATRVMRTDRGLRVALREARAPVLEQLAGVPGLSRVTVRATTLEDVYFAVTA